MSDQHILQTPQQMMRNKFVEDETGTHVVDGDGRIVRQVVLDGVERTIALAPASQTVEEANASLARQLLHVLNAADAIGFRIGTLQGSVSGSLNVHGNVSGSLDVHGNVLGPITTAEAVALIESWASMDYPEITRDHYPVADTGAGSSFSVVRCHDNGMTLKVFTEYSADLGSDVDDTTGGPL